jgi:hypothetical protein
MSDLIHHLVINNDSSTITFTDGADSVVVSSDDSWAYSRALNAVHDGTSFEEVRDMVSGESTVITGLSDRISVSSGGTVIFDGEPIHSAVADSLVRYHREGRDVSGIVQFMERAANNPSTESRDQLWNWLGVKGLEVNADGYIIGYKALNQDMTSIHTGTAFVNGVKYNGHIPNELGTTVTMPRDKVDSDANSSCSHGLHIGTLDFANGFGGHNCNVVVLLVDPADVVSVPSSDHSKMRSCGYIVHDLYREHFDYEPEPDGDEMDYPTGDEIEALYAEDIPTSWLDKMVGLVRRNERTA